MARHSESDHQSDAHSGEDSNDHGWSTKTRIILALVGIAAFAAIYLIAVTLLPRVWTNFITGMTNNSVLTSWLLGLLIGFAFALLPILVFLMGMRLRKSWKGVIGWLIAAVACALPNIITIAVSTGDKKAEEAAANDMILKAPGFITASYVGIAFGIGVGLWVAWVTYSRRRAKQKAAKLQAQKESDARDAVSDAADSAHDAASNATDSAVDAASDAAGAARDTAGDTAVAAHDAATGTGQHATDSIRDHASDVAGAATEHVSDHTDPSAD